MQLPPTSKAQGGAGAGCDGYGLFDPRDLGAKNQQGSIPTRYGSRDSLARLVAVAHACDLDVYLDLVMHQRMGENGGPGVFRYLSADGHDLSGRGETTPGWFRGVLDFGEWVFRTTGADGARFDDVKGTWAPFVHEFMTHGAMASRFSIPSSSTATPRCSTAGPRVLVGRRWGEPDATNQGAETGRRTHEVVGRVGLHV